MSWKSPTGYLDYGNEWTDEILAYDDNDATYAHDLISPNSWSDFLELTINALSCNKVRFKATYSDASINTIDLDVYYDGAYHHVYQGSYDIWTIWNEKSLGGTYSVTKAKVRFYNTKDLSASAHLYEFDFWQVVAPTVTTQAVSDIGLVTATGNGNITATGGLNATKRGICWNTTGDPDVNDSKSEEIGSFGTEMFTRPMTGLSRGEKYYVKAYAYNEIGYGYGSEVTFYTYPSVTTHAPTDIIRADPTTVTGNGLIELDTTGTIDTRGFQYGLTETPTWSDSSTGPFSEGSYTETIDGALTADTTYYIRAYATSTGAWGTAYGSYVEFKTAYPYGPTKTEIKSEKTASDSEIVDVGGKRSLLIENHLIQNQTLADLIAEAYLDEYKEQKTKLVVTRPTPAPYEIGDTIERSSALLPYYASTGALISYAVATSAIHPYGLAGRDMLIRKLNVSFSAGNYVSVIELED